MPECHKCEWDGKQSKRCLKCKGPAETNHKGRSIVSLDAKDGREFDFALPVGSISDPVRAVADTLRSLLQLDPVTQRLIMRMMLAPDQSLTCTATRMGLSLSAAHGRLKRARTRIPALKGVIPMRLLSDGRRKKAHDGA